MLKKNREVRILKIEKNQIYSLPLLYNKLTPILFKNVTDVNVIKCFQKRLVYLCNHKCDYYEQHYYTKLNCSFFLLFDFITKRTLRTKRSTKCRKVLYDGGRG